VPDLRLHGAYMRVLSVCAMWRRADVQVAAGSSRAVRPPLIPSPLPDVMNSSSRLAPWWSEVRNIKHVLKD